MNAPIEKNLNHDWPVDNASLLRMAHEKMSNEKMRIELVDMPSGFPPPIFPSSFKCDPAFPQKIGGVTYFGMSRRTYIATEAMKALIGVDELADAAIEAIAEAAVRHADAIIKALGDG